MDSQATNAPTTDRTSGATPKLVIVLKGYPRTSETFIAQEILGLQQAGLDLEIVSLRHPYDDIRHPVHDLITAKVRYLPEALADEPMRVARAGLRAIFRRGFWRALRMFARDVLRDPTPNRARRFGQALVLAAEAPDEPIWLHSHFAHTPASVTRYGAAILGRPFSVSAHAKDIWTTPEWDLGDKLRDARWMVTCTQVGRERLAEVAPGATIHLSYHGLDLDSFTQPTGEPSRRDGRDPLDPVRIVSVGRAVPKKGYDILLLALAQLPRSLHWTFEHVGRGPELDRLVEEARRLGLDDRITWRGAQAQADVLKAYRRSDIFVLASRKTEDSDQDGLPNVLVEAASQRLACVATDFSAIPELFRNGVSGLLVPSDDAEKLAAALADAISDPDLRLRLGQSAFDTVRRDFDFRPGIRHLVSLFEDSWSPAPLTDAPTKPARASAAPAATGAHRHPSRR